MKLIWEYLIRFLALSVAVALGIFIVLLIKPGVSEGLRKDIINVITISSVISFVTMLRDKVFRKEKEDHLKRFIIKCPFYTALTLIVFIFR
jgi:hypothetical protein